MWKFWKTVIFLECGHECSLLCHPVSTFHTCTKPCSRSCEKGHPCSGLCGEACKPCSRQVQVLLPCSHQGNLTCSEDLEKYECTEKCSKILGKLNISWDSSTFIFQFDKILKNTFSQLIWLIFIKTFNKMKFFVF